MENSLNTRRKNGHSTDNNLIKALQQGEKKAWAHFYKAYSASLTRVIRQIIDDPQLAEDVLQLAYIKIWSSLKSYDPLKGAFFTWILNIAKNQAIDVTRSRSFINGKNTNTLMVDGERLASFGTTMINVGMIDMLALIKKLRPPEARLIKMVYYTGYTQIEAAKILAIPLSSVKSQLRKSMKNLRKVYAYCDFV